MEENRNVPFMEEIMHQFAQDTGLLENWKPQRYLWTDAFAVCNFLELHRLTGKDEYQKLALRLINQVHHVLGRHREDDLRGGWISGLSESEGEQYPTIGGLRIGKELLERQPHEGEDNLLEWDRDGQYYHYLTKWMHALHQAAVRTEIPVYNIWARELAIASHDAFTYRPAPGGPKRMYWKMSIDLSRPLITSMGQHDPMDGYLSYLELQDDTSTVLTEKIAEMEEICRGIILTTDDPLGLGGLLSDALRLVKLKAEGKSVPGGLLEDLLQAANDGLAQFSAQNSLRHPVEYRLAFRELGLSIGLHAVAAIQRHVADYPEIAEGSVARLLHLLSGYESLSGIIEESWLNPRNRQTGTWKTHENINMVMLVTSLAPGGFFGA
jgi:hypothetical protein